MGGAKRKMKKKNCSGCKGVHVGPWGPKRCTYMLSGGFPGSEPGTVPGLYCGANLTISDV